MKLVLQKAGSSAGRVLGPTLSASQRIALVEGGYENKAEPHLLLL